MLNRKRALLFLAFLMICLDGYGQVETIENPEWGKWQEKDKSPISFELVQTFGTDFPDESAVFSSIGNINQVATDESNNVYVLDYGKPMLVKFSPDGTVLWKVDQRGRGPGDINDPLGMAVNDKYVFVGNLYGTRIDLFSKQAEYQKSFNTEEIEGFGKAIVGLIQDSLLVLKSGLPGKIGAGIFVLDTENDFKLVSEFEAVEESEHSFEIPERHAYSTQITILDDNIVVGGGWSYSSFFYDVEGNILKIINRDFPRFFRPGLYQEGQMSQLVYKGAPKGLHRIVDGYLINSINWSDRITDSDKLARQLFKRDFPKLGLNHSFDLYSSNGELLYSIENDRMINDIGIIKHSDSEGYLYAVLGKPYPQVLKYRVVIDD